MKVGGEDESKKVFGTGKGLVRDVTIKYGRLAVFIRHDSAEIWRFMYSHLELML